MALSDVKVLDLEIRADKAKAGAKDFDAATDRVSRSAGKAEAATGKLGKSLAAGFAGAAIFQGVAKALDLFTDVLGAAVSEAAQGEAVYRQLEAAVRSTGGAAGKSAEQMSDMATQLQRTSTFADDLIMGAQGVLLAFTRIKGENFDRTLQAVLDVSERTGSGLEETAKKIGAALNDPANAMRGLRNLGISLSASQKDVIKDLVATGNAAQAQAVILSALEGRYGGAASAARDTFAGAMKAVKNEANDLLEALGQGIVPVLKAIALELAQNGPEWVRWATMAGKAIGAVVSAAAILAGAVVASVGQVMQAFSTFFQKFAVFFGIIGKIPALRAAVGAVGDLGAEIEALGQSVGGAGASAFLAILEPIAKLGPEAIKAGEGLGALGDELDTLPRQLDEVSGAAAKLINHTLRLREFSRLTAGIKMTVDVDGAMDGAVAKLIQFIDLQETSGQLSSTEATVLRDRIALQEQLNQAVKNGLPVTEAMTDAAVKSVSTIKATIEKGFDWNAWVAEPGKQAWAATRDAAFDAITDIITGAEVDFKQLFAGILKMWIRTLIEMVARQRAANLAAGGTSGGAGGGGGWMSAAGQVFGIGGTGGASGATSAFTGAYAGAAWGAVFVAVVAAILHQAKTSGRAEVDTVLAFGGAGGINLDLASSRYNKQGGVQRFRAQVEATQALIKEVLGIIQSLGGTIDQFGDASAIKISREGQGKNMKWAVYLADGTVRKFTNDFDAAMQFATIQAVKATPTRGLDPIVKAAIQRSIAEKLDQFQRDVQLAQQVANMGLDPLQVEMRQASVNFDELRRSITELLGPSEELNLALGNITKSEVAYWQATRDALTGRVKTKAEQLQELKDKAALWNSEKALRLASLNAEIIDKKARMELLKVEIDLIKAELAMGSNRLVGRRDLILAEQDLNEAYTRAQLAALQAQYSALQISVDALQKVFDALAQLEDIDIDGIKLPTISGAGGRGGKTAALDLIAGSKRNQMSDFGGQLFDLNKRFDDAAKGVKNNADLLAKLNKARQDEINLLKQQVKDQYAPYLKNWGKSDFRAGINDFLKNLSEIPDALLTPWEKALIKARFLKEQNRDVTARLKEFGGDLFPTAAIDDVRDTANGLRDDLAALAAQGIDVAARLRLVGEAEAFRLQQIEFGLVDTLFGYLKGSAEWGAKAVEFEKQKIQLQFAVIEAQLRALGVWDKYADLFGAAFKAAMDAAGQITAPTGGSSFESTVNTFADVIKEATDRWRNATRQIADFYRNLMFGNQSPLTGMQTVEAALAAYNSTAALARGGNLGAREQFTTVAQTLLDVLDRAYGSTEFSARLRAQIAADSQNLLGQTSFNEGGVTYGVSWTAVDRSVQDGTRRLVEAVQQAQASQANGSTANAAAISTLAQAILARDGSSIDPELAARLDRVIALWEAEQRRNAA